MKRASSLLLLCIILPSCRKAGEVTGKTAGAFVSGVSDEVDKVISDSVNRAVARADARLKAAHDKIEAEKAQKSANSKSQWDPRTQQFPPGFTPTNKESWKK